MKEFRPEDFDSRTGIQQWLGSTSNHVLSTKEAALVANAKVGEWLEAALVVTCERKVVHSKVWKEPGLGHENDTHTARLVCIEPIVRESEERQLLRKMFSLDIGASRENLEEFLRCQSRLKAILGLEKE